MKLPQVQVLFIIGLICLVPSILPYTQKGFFHLHDFTHVTRLSELDRALTEGHFPPLWSKNLGFGYGLPQFIFYGPLAYYFAEIFKIIGFGYLEAIKLMVISAFISGYAIFFAIGRRLGGSSWGGLLSGLVFTYAPYRAVDAYVRGAFGEMWAMTLIGIVLYAALLYAEKMNARRLVWLGISLALIPLAHNLTAIISFPFLFLIIFGLVIVTKEPLFKKVLGIVGPFLLAMLLSAYYILPAWFEKGFTRVDDLTQGFSNYRYHFLYWRQYLDSYFDYGASILGPDDEISFYVGLLLLALALLGALIVMIDKKLRRNYGLFVGIVSVSIAVALWLGTLKSQPLWDRLALLAYIQFPWRFLVLVVPLLAVLSGFISRYKVLAGKGPVTVVVVVSLIGILGHYTRFFRPLNFLSNPSDLYYSDELKIQSHMSSIIPDFMPKYGTAVPLSSPPAARFEWATTGEKISPELDRTHEFILRLDQLNDYRLKINIAYFPGWVVYIDGKRAEPEIDPIDGTLLVDLSQYRDGVVVSGAFMETPLRKLANTLTLTSLAGCIYLIGKNLSAHDTKS